MKHYFLFLSLFVGAAQSEELHSSPDVGLAHILSTMKILYKSENYPIVQVIQSWETLSECGGTYESCPNARLLLTYSMGDLYDPPLLFELPKSKGWRFISANEQNDGLYLTLVTTLEGANISKESRESWVSKKYVVRVRPDSNTIHLIE